MEADLQRRRQTFDSDANLCDRSPHHIARGEYPEMGLALPPADCQVQPAGQEDPAHKAHSPLGLSNEERPHVQLYATPFSGASPSLRRALERLLAHTGQRVRAGVRAAGTLTMQEAHVRWLLERLGGECLLESLTSRKLHELAEQWHVSGGVGGRPISLKTLAKRLSTLRRALRLAAVAGEIDRLPLFPEIGLPPMRPRLRVLKTVSELRRLMAALPQERADWVALAVWSCQRPGDVERMTWADVGFGPPSMVIRSTKTRRPFGIRVKMPSPMVQVLRARNERLAAAGRPPLPSDPIVRPWPNRSNVLPVVAVRIGLQPLSAIDLRHTGFSWMIRRTGITRAAQEWGGWSDFAMLSKYYAHALPPQLTEASDELASMADNDNGAPANDNDVA